MLDLLLEEAGITVPVAGRESVSTSGLTNRTAVVTLVDGSRYVLRQYSWPHESPDDLDRLRKEIYLHELLAENEVAVPRIVASLQGEEEGAVLLEYLPGKLLGDVVLSPGSREIADAWASCGAQLRRVHGIRLPGGESGMIAGDRVRPFEGGSWGHFHFYNILHHAERALSRVSSDVPVATLRGVLEPAIPILNRAEVSLLHNDAHPWNVLVKEDEDGWACSGWLDWEFAWVGDPTWDLVRMDLIRTRPIGPSPRAFYDGYGKEPGEPYRCIYELSILLWMANQYLDGDRFLTPTYEVAMRYVEELGSKVDRIDSLIAEVA